MGDVDSPSRPSAGYAATIQRAQRPKDEEPPYEEGTLLAGRYRIQRRLGEGGMGRVYEAEHLELGRRVAVKVMRRKYADQKAMVERFRLEARSASMIGHPNVVQVFDYGTTEAGEGFIVMELLDGAPLERGHQAAGADGAAARAADPERGGDGAARGARLGRHPSRSQARQHLLDPHERRRARAACACSTSAWPSSSTSPPTSMAG